MAKFQTFEEMCKNISEEALDEYIYNGKTLREWIDILNQQTPHCDEARKKLVLEGICKRFENEGKVNPINH